MASSTILTVVERSRISPPPGSVPPVSLPLTLFDIPFLLFAPNQPLFFYDFPTSTAHFTQTILPKLKQTLSLTLQQFFPLAGKLVMPTALYAEPHLEYAEDDFLFLTVAEAPAGDFKNLVGDHPKMSRDFHGLVPVLSAAVGLKQPLLAVQITVFPETGISMGFTLRNVVADWRTFKNFLSAWALLNRNGGVLGDEQQVAFHDRSVIIDPSGLGSTFVKEWWNIENELKQGSNYDNGSANDMIRATFVFGPKEVEQIKKWILTRSEMQFGSTQLLLSPCNIACAFIWVCWTKTHCSQNEVYGGQDVHYFGYIAGGVPRLPYVVPSTYVGNCVGFGRSSATRRELLGENGVIYAVKAIGDTVKKVNGDIMAGAKNWISEWKVMRESDLHVILAGSPKLLLYELDFGWGKPMKFEEVSIDVSIDATGAISVTETREAIGGIEVGVALTKSKMDAFTTLFYRELNQILDCE